MLLVIEPNTPKGEIQLEAIKWAEDQMNGVLAKFFDNKYRIQKGIRLNFKIRLDLKMNETVKVELLELSPETEQRFNEAVEEAKSNLIFKSEQEVQRSPESLVQKEKLSDSQKG